MTIDMTFERREELIRIEEREEGRMEGKRLAIIELLEELGVVPDELREVIMSQTDTEMLSKMHKLVARCNSIEEFEGKLNNN